MKAAPAIVEEARGWLLDCGIDAYEVVTATDRRVLAIVDYYYEGGLAAFLADAGELDS